MSTITSPLQLRSGLVLPNRLVKAAMTEALADDLSRPTPELCKLYETWSAGGTGTLITGNVQIDGRYQERPGNVCLDGPQDKESRELFKKFAQAMQAHGSKAFVQLGHPGRQSNTMINLESVAPGDIGMDRPHGMPKFMAKGFCAKPRALTLEEVKAIPGAFADAALVCKECGFDGIQLHAAHGYLLSQFLSPLANNRPALFGASDPYGGSLENRARLLLESVRAVRQKAGSNFSVSVKLNSADFQAGGFSAEEALQVAQWLEKELIDLLEISGGNYESGIYGKEATETALGPKKASTLQREAYFLEYAKEVTKALKEVPVMVTGGFRQTETMNGALAQGDCALIGLGRPLCGDPMASGRLLSGAAVEIPRFESTLVVGNCLGRFILGLLPRSVSHMLKLASLQSWYYRCIWEIAQTGKVTGTKGAFACFLWNMWREVKLAKAVKNVNATGSAHKPS